MLSLTFGGMCRGLERALCVFSMQIQHSDQVFGISRRYDWFLTCQGFSGLILFFILFYLLSSKVFFHFISNAYSRYSYASGDVRLQMGGSSLTFGGMFPYILGDIFSGTQHLAAPLVPSLTIT
jgi:hypothetical protein